MGRLLENVLKTLTAMSVMGLASSVLLGAVSAVVMYVGARQILDGHITLGGFFTYTLLLGFLVAPLFQVVAIGTQLTEAAAGLERTREVMKESPEDQDPRRTVDARPAGRPRRLRGRPLRIRGGPAGAERHLVRGAAGHGHSAGRPVRLGEVHDHRPDRGVPHAHGGTHLVDGVDLSTVRLGSYRTQLGVVLQETFLFDGSIRENVAFSRPDATEEEVLAACRLARVDAFAETFPDGYDTIVGERGVKLSGGQRQRVSIARALLADPRILILDEATSSLDSESEALIQEGLAHLMKGRTTFVIAHRLSTIRRADQILVVEEGRIVERGTHAELLARGARYAEMYRRQHDVGVEPVPGPRRRGQAAGSRPKKPRPRRRRAADAAGAADRPSADRVITGAYASRRVMH